jgi:type III pantothenate kinase
MGTAISFSVVARDGRFLGGAIAPGVSTQVTALSEKTALLPRISLAHVPRALGRDTVACLEAGVFFGSLGIVDRITEALADDLGEPLHGVATGGDAPLIAPHCRRISEIVPDLTLEGIYLALSKA